MDNNTVDELFRLVLQILCLVSGGFLLIGVGLVIRVSLEGMGLDMSFFKRSYWRSPEANAKVRRANMFKRELKALNAERLAASKGLPKPRQISAEDIHALAQRIREDEEATARQQQWMMLDDYLDDN